MGPNSKQNGEENFGESCADPELVCFGMVSRKSMVSLNSRNNSLPLEAHGHQCYTNVKFLHSGRL